jgi:hypothetical protein
MFSVAYDYNKRLDIRSISGCLSLSLALSLSLSLSLYIYIYIYDIPQLYKDYCNYNTENEIFVVCLLVAAW